MQLIDVYIAVVALHDLAALNGFGNRYISFNRCKLGKTIQGPKFESVESKAGINCGNFNLTGQSPQIEQVVWLKKCYVWWSNDKMMKLRILRSCDVITLRVTSLYHRKFPTVATALMFDWKDWWWRWSGRCFRGRGAIFGIQVESSTSWTKTDWPGIWYLIGPVL